VRHAEAWLDHKFAVFDIIDQNDCSRVKEHLHKLAEGAGGE
jgi:hypothetical protein